MGKQLVALDPGHYRNTAGKRSPDSSLFEYEFNQDVANIAEIKLINTGLVDVLVTKRISDTYDDDAGLRVRSNLINSKGAAISISIHANAHINEWTSARGFEVYSYPGSVEGAKLAKVFHNHYKSKLAPFGVPDRGCKTANFAMVREPLCPAILVEYEFFTNQDGCELLKRNDFRNACADTIVAATLEYLGLSASAPISDRMLQEGTVGDDVKSLQNDLIVLKYLVEGSNDGDFGPNTKNAVIRFQTDNSLAADGVVGPITKAKIQEAIDKLSKIDYEKELCRIILNGENKLALTGVTKCEDYVRSTDWIGNVVIQCVKNSVVLKEFTLSTPIVDTKPIEPQPLFATMHPIMGESEATAEQMSQLLLKNNPNPKINVSALELANIYLEEGKIEGVRGDIAFAQSIHETGWFAFRGDVKPEQNNFAGIGTVGGGVLGHFFPDARTGVRAQIQHLKAYATMEPLKMECVDPRYSLVSPKGKAPTLEELGGKWAVPGYSKTSYPDFESAARAEATYGQLIYKLLEKIKNEIVEKPTQEPKPDPVEEKKEEDTSPPVQDNVSPEVVESVLTMILQAIKDFILSLLKKNKKEE